MALKLWFQQRGVGLSSSNPRAWRNSKELITLNLVEEFTAVRIGFRIFNMKTVQSQMLEHRNQKGDLPREKSGGFGRGRNSAAKPKARHIFNFKTTIKTINHTKNENTNIDTP